MTGSPRWARSRRASPTLPPVLSSESRLSQVFLNLVINALQAMPSGGPQRHTLRIRTAL